MITNRLFTAKDVVKAYPYITPETIKYRIKKGFLRLSHQSSGTGIPHVLKLPELVHAGVQHEQALLGLFSDLASITADIEEMVVSAITTEHPFTVEEPGSAPRQVTEYTPPPTRTARKLEDPFDFDPGFYEKHQYRCVVRIQVLHEAHMNLAGHAFISLSEKPKSGSFFHLTYMPDTLNDVNVCRRNIENWAEEPRRRDGFAIAFISVRALYERACEALELTP